MKKLSYTLQSSVLLFTLVFSQIASAEQVPGTGVSLTPPEGFSASSRFPGFMNEEDGSSIMVNEIPGPFDKIIAGFEDKEKVRAQGIEVLSREKTEVSGRPSVLLQMRQSAYGTDYKKWALIVDREGETTLLVATYPKQVAQIQEAPLKKALLEISLVKASDPLDSLNFSVTPSPGLKIAKAIGQTIILNTSGTIPEVDPMSPAMVIGMSATAAEIPGDKTSFAETRLKKTAGMKEVAIRGSSPTTIDGLEGVASSADAVDIKTGTAMFVYQVLLFDSSGYSIIQGIVAAEKEKVVAPMFEQTARSFSLKRDEKS